MLHVVPEDDGTCQILPPEMNAVASAAMQFASIRSCPMSAEPTPYEGKERLLRAVRRKIDEDF
jgi:hypothetical protein